MITAIPMNDDRVASHFTKAHCLVFLDEQGKEISRIANPAREEKCAGKQQMVDLLAEKQVGQVIVRNIGEQMLGKLLARQFAVYQTHCGRRSPSELVNTVSGGLTQLEQASQGRQSLHHEAKKNSGGCGCNHDGHNQSRVGCGSNEPHQEQGTHCHQGQHGRGRGRCCHS